MPASIKTATYLWEMEILSVDTTSLYATKYWHVCWQYCISPIQWHDYLSFCCWHIRPPASLHVLLNKGTPHLKPAGVSSSNLALLPGQYPCLRFFWSQAQVCLRKHLPTSAQAASPVPLQIVNSCYMAPSTSCGWPVSTWRQLGLSQAISINCLLPWDGRAHM